MLHNVDDAAFVNVWGRVWFVTADNRFLLTVYELASRACVLQHVVAKAFKDRLEFVPLEIRWRWRRAEPLKGLLVL